MEKWIRLPKPPVRKVWGVIYTTILSREDTPKDAANIIYHKIGFKLVIQKYWYEIQYKIYQLKFSWYEEKVKRITTKGKTGY
jgi:hypothetical protein